MNIVALHPTWLKKKYDDTTVSGIVADAQRTALSSEYLLVNVSPLYEVEHRQNLQQRCVGHQDKQKTLYVN